MKQRLSLAIILNVAELRLRRAQQIGANRCSAIAVDGSHVP